MFYLQCSNDATVASSFTLPLTLFFRFRLFLKMNDLELESFLFETVAISLKEINKTRIKKASKNGEQSLSDILNVNSV